jgi:ATP-binding protein involved in chromosome partitioning
MDPRPAVISNRVEGVGRILAVTGGKGGIGKSLVSTALAVTLAGEGLRTGLLDLDLTGPCDHLFLGHSGSFPEEDFGVIPPLVGGVRFMSIAHFGGDRPAPLRGADVSEAVIEILAITRWLETDVLVIDMPPGLGDATLDVVRLLPRAEFLVVSTGNRVVVETVRKTLGLLRRVRAPVVGVVENMARTGDGGEVRGLAGEFECPFLGVIPWDDGLEGAVGDPDRLARTSVAASLREIGVRTLA